MKKLLALLLALTLPAAALAERYTDVAKHYLNTYGQWWNYSQELWLEYAAATRASDVSGSGGSTARGIAATEYTLPPEDALSPEEAAAIAIGTDPDLRARPLVPCFMLDGRAMYKVILYLPGADSAFSRTVEMDAMTGEILSVPLPHGGGGLSLRTEQGVGCRHAGLLPRRTGENDLVPAV